MPSRDASRPPLWARPDPVLAAAGVEGEALVARIRLAAVALLLIAPTIKLVREPDHPVHVWGFGVTVVAAIAAIAIWWRLRRGWWRPWIGFASSALDVTLVTTALVTFLLVDAPMTALNSKVTFEIYFLALGATSLRYDPRICITIGALVLVEYGGLWAAAALTADLSAPASAGDSGAYSPIDQATRLVLLAFTVVLAVTIVRRAQRLLYLAARDRLTGVYNRRYFDRALVLEVERGDRYHHPLALVILDLDHFKAINDRHGHPAGDAVLVAVATRLETALRRTDIIARYGGDELVVLLPETTREAALARIESLRRQINEAPVVIGDDRAIAIDFSAGVAAFPEDPDTGTAAGLLACADARLLLAKRGGRGRCVAGEPVTSPAEDSAPART